MMNNESVRGEYIVADEEVDEEVALLTGPWRSHWALEISLALGELTGPWRAHWALESSLRTDSCETCNNLLTSTLSIK